MIRKVESKWFHCDKLLESTDNLSINFFNKSINDNNEPVELHKSIEQHKLHKSIYLELREVAIFHGKITRK